MHAQTDGWTDLTTLQSKTSCDSLTSPLSHMPVQHYRFTPGKKHPSYTMDFSLPARLGLIAFLSPNFITFYRINSCYKLAIISISRPQSPPWQFELKLSLNIKPNFGCTMELCTRTLKDLKCSIKSDYYISQLPN